MEQLRNLAPTSSRRAITPLTDAPFWLQTATCYGQIFGLAEFQGGIRSQKDRNWAILFPRVWPCLFNICECLFRLFDIESTLFLGTTIMGFSGTFSYPPTQLTHLIKSQPRAPKYYSIIRQAAQGKNSGYSLESGGVLVHFYDVACANRPSHWKTHRIWVFPRTTTSCDL